MRRLCEALAATQQWPGREDPLLAGLKPGQRRHLKRRWQLLCELPRLGNWPPAKLLAHVIEAIDAEKVLRRSASRREKADDDVRLLDVLIEQAGELANDPDAFIELLRNPVENRPDGVLISTVHGAKGLEWPLVMLWGLNEEDFPHFSRDNPLSPQRLEEERRLYYVAITRARERLLLLHDGGEHRPSRFLAESAVAECERVGQALASESEAVSASASRRWWRATRACRLPVGATPVREMATVAPAAGWQVGERLHHANFGAGEVVLVEGDPADPVIEVRFEGAGRRRLIASRAPLARIA